MKKNYRFSLEKYNGTKSRHKCPKCGHSKVFTLYIDNETGQYLSSEVGRCSREIKCGYHYKPKDYLNDNPNAWKNIPQGISDFYGNSTKEKPSFMPDIWVYDSQAEYDKNNFIRYLATLLDDEILEQLITDYRIGTSFYVEGGTIFWQVDLFGNVRTGKIIRYDSETGKREKLGGGSVSWVHKIDEYVDTSLDYNELTGFVLEQCLFGEHLLNMYANKPVAIVESEKTAIIASVYFPDYLWLATGGLHNLTPKRCQMLLGRQVILFPDLGAYSKWAEKLERIKYLGDFSISNLLEEIATEGEKEDGLDLADYLVKYDPKQFISK